MLHWIIFVLTLCTAIMSVVHGVFIVLGALPVSGGAYPALPQNIVTMMPIISAMIALIGGVIAFSRNKFSILFFLGATVACALGSQDVWLYGGVYFFAGIFCFFLRRKPQDPDYLSNYYVEEGDFSLDPGAELDPDDNANSVLLEQNNSYNSSNRIFLNQRRNIEQNPNFDDDINEFKNDINLDIEQEQTQDSKSQVQTSPVKIRGRTSKSCPTCGNIVARDVNFCPNCGTQLHIDPSLSLDVPAEESHEEPPIKNNPDNMPLNIKSEIPKLSIPETTSEINTDSDSDDGSEENTHNDFAFNNQPNQPNQHNSYNQSMQSMQSIQSEVLSYNSPTSISNLLEKNNNSNDNLSETESEQEVYKVSGANFAQRKNFQQNTNNNRINN